MPSYRFYQLYDKVQLSEEILVAGLYERRRVNGARLGVDGQTFAVTSKAAGREGGMS